MGHHMVHPFVHMSLFSYLSPPPSAGFSGGTSSSHPERDVDVDVDVAQVVRRRAADLQGAGRRPHRLLPEPETPANTVSRRFGIAKLTSLRLFSRAPCTRI